jgi:lipopolysaccharide/colanic/teichoic acid biosynthesis glycosyltransferase
MKAGKANSWGLELLLPVIDSLALAGAFFLAFWFRIESGLLQYGPEADILSYYQLFFFSLPLFWIIFYAIHLYDPHDIFYGTFEYIQVIKGVAFGVLGVIVVNFFFHHEVSRGWLMVFWLLGTCFTGMARFSFRRIIRPLFRSGQRSERALVLGASEEARTIAQTLIKTGRMKVIGFLDDFSPIGEEVLDGIVVKGSPQDCERVAREEGVSQLVLVPGATSWETYHEILSEAVKWNGLNVLIAPRFGGLFSVSLRVSYLSYVPMLRLRFGYLGGLDRFAKILLDGILGSVSFVLSLPVMLGLSLCILCRKGWPVYESHLVSGRYGRPFHTYKFRTGLTRHRHFNSPLTTTSEAAPQKFSLERFLLTFGLDKLPQLINVLCGQMSLVGPRTIYQEGASSYGIWLPRMMAVKPGMTGPWAMCEVPDLQQEISLTLSYINSWTPWKDLQILLFTLFFLAQKKLSVPADELVIKSSERGATSAMEFPQARRDRIESGENLFRKEQ